MMCIEYIFINNITFTCCSEYVFPKDPTSAVKNAALWALRMCFNIYLN